MSIHSGESWVRRQSVLLHGRLSWKSVGPHCAFQLFVIGIKKSSRYTTSNQTWQADAVFGIFPFDRSSLRSRSSPQREREILGWARGMLGPFPRNGFP
jgi:hypothetical protein